MARHPELVVVLTLSVGACVASCGSDPAFDGAQRTVHLSSRALADVGADAPEAAEVRGALADGEARLAEAERALDIWQQTGTGRSAWETVATCLGSALARLQEALVNAGGEVPPDLEQALVQAEAAGVGTCQSGQ